MCSVEDFENKKNVLSTQYELYGHTLEVVDSSKDLGVTINDPHSRHSKQGKQNDWFSVK